MAIVRYLVKDVDESIAFYSILGFEVAERWGPPFAILSRGDLSLWLSGPGTSASKPLADGSQPVGGGWNRFVIQIDDLDATMTALKSASVRFRSERPPVLGRRNFRVSDDVWLRPHRNQNRSWRFCDV